MAPRFPFRPVPHEPNLLLSCVAPRNILEVATEMDIGDVVVFPSFDARHEPDYPLSFEYRVLPGIMCDQGWSEQYFRDEMYDVINWIKVRVNGSSNRKVLLVDESGGHAGAALVLLCFLTTERLHSFDAAVELIEKHVLRSKIQIPEWFFDWTHGFYCHTNISLQIQEPTNIKWFVLNEKEQNTNILK